MSELTSHVTRSRSVVQDFKLSTEVHERLSASPSATMYVQLLDLGAASANVAMTLEKKLQVL